jgi:hypothetical protein
MVVGTALATALTGGACRASRDAPRPADADRAEETSTTIESATSTSTPPPTTTSAAAARTSAGFPADRKELEHGGTTWAVVLDGGRVPEGGRSHDVFREAEAAATAAGYETGPTDCDVGAEQALGLPDEVGIYTVSVYFSQRSEAEESLAMFRARGWTRGVVAEVQTFCLD